MCNFYLEEEQELTPPNTSTNSHFLIYGTSGSGKTKGKVQLNINGVLKIM